MELVELFRQKIAVDAELDDVFDTTSKESGAIAAELSDEIDDLKYRLKILKEGQRVYRALHRLGLESEESVGEAMFSAAMEEAQGNKDPDIGPLLEKASDLGCPEATIAYGKALVLGQYGLGKNVEEGLRLLGELAENGDANACYAFVEIHKACPEAVGPDLAYAMCQKAAESGHAKAIVRLKKPFEMTKETQNLLARAESGEKEVYFLLFQRGDLSLDRREDFFGLALENGDPNAEFEMGKILRDKGDEEGAKEFFRRAVEHGSALACFVLARLLLGKKPHFYHGGGIPDRNDPIYQEEFALMKRAAELGDFRALCVMGRAYVRGYMVDKDYAVARKYLFRAFEMGERVSSPRLIAETYRYSPEEEGSATKAVEYYLMSANAGNRSAMLGLMDIYEEGLREVPKDLAKAAYYRYLAGGNF